MLVLIRQLLALFECRSGQIRPLRECWRLIDSCITQFKAQGPSRTCNKSKEEEDEYLARASRSRAATRAVAACSPSCFPSQTGSETTQFSIEEQLLRRNVKRFVACSPSCSVVLSVNQLLSASQPITTTDNIQHGVPHERRKGRGDVVPRRASARSQPARTTRPALTRPRPPLRLPRDPGAEERDSV